MVDTLFKEYQQWHLAAWLKSFRTIFGSVDAFELVGARARARNENAYIFHGRCTDKKANKIFGICKERKGKD